MTKIDMATLPGLHLRGGVYQLRVVVPLDLRGTYGGKSKITQSLDTSKYRDAVLLGTQERAKRLEEFARQRQALQPQRLDTVTPEMASELAQRVRARVLHLDESAREDPKIRRALREINAVIGRSSLEHLTIAGHLRLTAPMDSLAGLSPEEAQTLAGLNDIMNKDAGVKLAQRSLSAVLPLVQKEAQCLGLTFDHTAPGGREALQAALKAYRQAWQEVTHRDAGEVVDTPVVTAIAKAAPKPSKLRDVYARWTGSKPRTQDTMNACLRSVVLFEEFTGNTPITQLTREQGDGFRAWLQHPDRKTTSKTARDRLVWVKSLLKYACRDLELISRNPWESLDIAFKTTNKRRPWTPDELSAFFGQELYTARKLPTDKKAGADAAYWIPLLGIYTGARVGELAQLRLVDVETSGAIPVLSITDEGEGQTVKTDAGVRKVPIHSELVRLGFLDHVEAMKAQGEVLLWPKLPKRADKPGGYFSHWFGEYRAALGFGQYPDFHCIRHTVRSQLADADVKEQTIDTLIGHEVKGSTGAKVYTHRAIVKLQAAVEVIAYPGLTLKPV